jgi:DNA-binding transcriptional LysR family regulator
MQSFDANLLFALDTLLEAGSVTGAADRMGVSVPAMSRTLSRIRKLMGDPIMVKAGRRLVATPKALEIRARLRTLVQEARELTSRSAVSASEAERTLTVRAEEAFIGVFSTAISRAIHSRAPKVAVRFASDADEAIDPLREGVVDLDIGHIKLRSPEVRLQHLFTSGFIGIAGSGHALERGKVTVERLLEYEHISASRRGLASEPIDRALAELGLTRTVALVVPTFSSALLAVTTSDLLAAVPEFLTRLAGGVYGLFVFPLPVKTEPNQVSMAWHPRFDSDSVHQLVRQSIVSVCSAGSAHEAAMTHRWSPP